MIISILGACLIVIVLGDFLTTTIGATAYSAVSRHVGRGSFALLRLLPDWPVKHRLSGVIVMSSVALWWIFGHALGWTLLLAGFEHAVVNSQTHDPANLIGIAAHVGNLLATVGGGVTRPGSAGWSLLEVLIGVNGMVVLTLVVSFVLSTTQTVVQGRAFLIKANMLDARADQSLVFALADLVAMLNAAPFALFYSSAQKDRRLPIALVDLTALDDPDWSPKMARLLTELPWHDDSDDRHAWAQRYLIARQ